MREKIIKYPSVTTVLAKYQDFGNVPEDRLALAIDRGKAVHAYCAAYAQSLWMPEPKEYAGYCLSFRRWFDMMVVEVRSVEEQFVDEVLGFTGRPDFTGILKGDTGLAVTDWKTPLAINPMWDAQTAAYQHLTKAVRRGSLRLDPKGKPAKFKAYSNNTGAFQAFHAALIAHKFFIGEKNQ